VSKHKPAFEAERVAVLVDESSEHSHERKVPLDQTCVEAERLDQVLEVEVVVDAADRLTHVVHPPRCWVAIARSTLILTPQVGSTKPWSDPLAAALQHPCCVP